MNIISIYSMNIRRIVILVVFLSGSFSLIGKEENKEIKDRIVNMSSGIEMRYSEEVQSRIDLYTVKNKQAASVILGRASVYFPLFENILREKGLPDDLKYLAVVESSLNPHATSRMGAAGLWQFMKPTGRMQGLKINRVIDERRDPVKSTYAALDYLAYLYDRFGDWTLALAAYNCGPGNVDKAIRRAGTDTDYWSIQKYLPRETRGYLPKFIAFKYILSYYYEHDIDPIMPDTKLIYTASAQVFDKINLKTLADDLALDYTIVKLLNPAYIRGYIPASDGVYTLTLPEQEMYTFASANNIDIFYQNNIFNTTTTADGELSALMPGQQLVERGAIVSVKHLVPKETEALVADTNVSTQIAELHAKRRSENLVYKYYYLKEKESIADVARRENVSIRDIVMLNNFSEENQPTLGERIKVPVY